MNIQKLVRPSVALLKPYIPSPTLAELSSELNVAEDSIVKLDTGENPSVEPLMPKINLDQIGFSRYPDPSAKKLLQALSNYTGFRPENLVCGSGSDELIDLLIRCFVNKGDEILICPPTFSMYSFYSQLAEAKIVEVLRKANLRVNVERVIQNISSQTKLIFIDSPGNPAGTLIKTNEVERLCQKNCIVVIDEAYFEYAGQTVASLINKYKNLVVLRTLSKWAGLAGLRIGYAIANPEVIKLLNTIKSPYNINVVAQSVAGLVVSSPLPILRKIKELAAQRDAVIQWLEGTKKFQVFPSQSAYLIFKLKDGQTAKLNSYISKQGVVLKSLDQPILGECLRLNVGTAQEIQRFKKVVNSWIETRALPYDAIIFDMDGVLIDVSKSYRKAIELTANRVLGTRKVNQRDVDIIKQVVGFNNDWDASFALIELVRKKLSKAEWPLQAKELLPIDRKAASYKRTYDIFQTYYLGSVLFKKQYKKAAPFNYTEGLISKEKSLIEFNTLKRLIESGYTLAIATGRPRFETLEAIKLAGLSSYFPERNVVAMEDAIREKPAPDPLFEAKRRINAQNPVYIGDSNNDVEAAKNAKMPCFAIGISGGDYSIKQVNEIVAYLKPMITDKIDS